MQPLELPRLPSDGRHYQLYAAPNGLLCLLISDPMADAASCVVQFRVGSHDEPERLPGLAHLLEHMLFMGSVDYPQAGSFPQLVSEWSGRFNASTAAERTRYHFSVNPAGLDACLAQLTDMLAAPLFSPDAVAAERQLIDAEFHTRLADEALHEQAALGQVFNPDHPLSRFSAGNLSTLGLEPEALAEALRAFHSRHYRAANGCVLIHASQPMAELQLFAARLAERLPAQPQAPRLSSGPLFTPQTLPGLLRWQSCAQQNQWLLLFALDNVQTGQGASALGWLCEWLASPAPAGALGWLRRQGLIAQLQVSTQHYTGQQSLLRIELDPLTGDNDYPALLNGFFSWLAALRLTPIQAWPQAARQRLADQAFTAGLQGEPLRWLTMLAERTLYQPPEQILESTGQWADLEEPFWCGLLEQLQPERLLLVQSQNDETALPQQTAWTHTRFAFSPLNWQPIAGHGQALAEADWPIWVITEPEAECHAGADADSLPGLRSIPLPIESEGQGRATVRLAWCWPQGQLDRYQRDRLKALWSLQTEPLHGWATASGISLAWQDQAGLIWLELQGPRQGLRAGVAAVVAAMARQPDLTQQHLAEHRHQRTLNERRQALPAYRLLEELDIQLSPTPNNTDSAQPAAAQVAWLYPREWQSESLKPITASLQQLCPRLSEPFNWQPPALRLLGEGTTTIQVDCQHADRAYILYCQAGSSSLAQRAGWELLHQYISTSFFDQLRTRQQLGYWVVARYHEVAGTPGLVLLVQSPTHEHQQIETAVSNWLESERKRLAELPFAQLRSQAQRLASHLRAQSRSSSGQLELHWAQGLGLPGAEVNDVCAALEQLTPAAWAETLDDWLQRPRRLRLLSRPVQDN